MFKTIYAIILLALPVAGSTAVPVEAEIDRDIVVTAMEDACRILEGVVACPDSLPVAVTTGMKSGLWGFYAGGSIVFINDILWGIQWDTFGYAILAHEIVHYMVEHDPVLAGIYVCPNEAFAWNVYNTIVQGLGRDDLYFPDWQVGYPQCQKRD